VRVTTANGCTSGATPTDFTLRQNMFLAVRRRHLKRRTLGGVKPFVVPLADIASSQTGRLF